MVSSSAPGGNVLPVDSQVTERPGKLVLLSFKHKWQEQDIELLAPPSVMGRGAFVARVSAGAGFEAAWLVSVPDGTPVKKHVGKVATVEEALPGPVPERPAAAAAHAEPVAGAGARGGPRRPNAVQLGRRRQPLSPGGRLGLGRGHPRRRDHAVHRRPEGGQDHLSAAATGGGRHRSLFLGCRTFGTQDDVDGGPFGMASLVLSEEPQEAWRGDRPADVAVGRAPARWSANGASGTTWSARSRCRSASTSSRSWCSTRSRGWSG